MLPRTYVFSCLAAAFLGAEVSGQHTLFVTHGDAHKHLFGGCVGRAGDVNADGHEDFVAGAPNPEGIGYVRIHSGKDGRLLYRFDGQQVGGFFGVCVTSAGDVNADGHGDVIVGASSYSNRAGKHEGMVKVYSGKDGTVLYTQFGYDHDSEFGFGAAGAGDVNKDGHDDFIVGSFREDAGFWDSGCARVFSGVDGSLLYTFNGAAMFTSFGLAVAGPGDLNGDGYDDVFIGAPRHDVDKKTNCGSATLFSGKDGTLLFSISGDLKNDEFGFAVSGAGDVNKDGVPDLVVGIPREDNTFVDGGGARVLSGKDGSTLYSFEGAAANDWFGWAVSGNGDLNGDGYSDIIVGALFADINGTDSGSITAYSGKDGSLLNHLDGKQTGDWFGQSVAMLGDVNRDGCGDFAIGAEREDKNGGDSGTVYVVSGKRLTLWSDTHALLLKDPGQQGFSMDFGPSHAGRSYWIFGSARGTHPGVVLGSVLVPLIPDSYTKVVMTHTNTPIFRNFRGTLDSLGRATAQFNLPGWQSQSIPFSLYHCALVFDSPTGTIFFASNPASLHLHN